MAWKRNDARAKSALPIADLFERSVVPQKKRASFGGMTWSFQQAGLLFLAMTLTVSGVTAAVAITLRGNSSTTDNVVSLGVGQAAANTCTNGTMVRTDTISSWDDNRGDFTLQQVDVSGVPNSCSSQAMTLVINMSSGPDLNITCNLPATGSDVYNQGTFVFASTSFTSTGSRFGCSPFTYPLYMASISAAAVQIK